MTKNTKEPAGASEPRKPISAHSLALQDESYAKRRLPTPTPPGAEDRTYCFRVEFEHDLFPLSEMLRWATETWWSSPLCPWGDADAKVTLKPGTLTLEELRWLFARVGDCHVAMETIELERDYTGERKYADEDELQVKVPSVDALKASLAGLENFQESLSCNEARAADAASQLTAALKAAGRRASRDGGASRTRRATTQET